MNVVGYATPGKAKAREILAAFCAGAGGQVVDGGVPRLVDGPVAAAFYGVTPATRHLWLQARTEGRPWFYIDNAYFDRCRGNYFRVTRDALQHHGARVHSNGTRLAYLIDHGLVEVMPWRRGGDHICIAPQSDEFMLVCAEYPKGRRWVDDIQTELLAATSRPLVVLPWTRDKAEWYRRLPAALAEAHALVTYSSASAISALLAGVPAFVTADDCIARPMSPDGVGTIETPRRAGDRTPWLQVVADNQWTLEEMRAGLCWRMLQDVETLGAS